MFPKDDGQFEQYLRQFEPRPPRPLAVLATAPGRSWRAPLGIAALVLLSLGIVLWSASHLRPSIRPSRNQQVVTQLASPVTLGQFNRLLRDDPAGFDAQLTTASRNLLPDVRRPEGSLSGLAGD